MKTNSIPKILLTAFIVTLVFATCKQAGIKEAEGNTELVTPNDSLDNMISAPETDTVAPAATVTTPGEKVAQATGSADSKVQVKTTETKKVETKTTPVETTKVVVKKEVVKEEVKVVEPDLVKEVVVVKVPEETKVTPPADSKWTVPEKDRNKANPIASDAESIKSGKALYVKHCTSCHGKTGAGDGSKAAQLKTPLSSFRLPAFQNQTDGSIFYKTRAGRDDMPSFEKKIPDTDDIWHLVNYLRTLQ